MAINANSTETDFLLIKQHIWQKFTNRLQEWSPSQGRTSSQPPPFTGMTPDVIVTIGNNTIIFEPRTPEAAIWLRTRYRLTAEAADEEAEILVHPNQKGQLTAELKAAGFSVAE